jgi:hypothetical protein
MFLETDKTIHLVKNHYASHTALKNYYRLHKSKLLDSIPSWTYPVHVLIP